MQKCRNKKHIYIVEADNCSPWLEVIHITIIRCRTSNLKGLVIYMFNSGYLRSLFCPNPHRFFFFSEEFSTLLQKYLVKHWDIYLPHTSKHAGGRVCADTEVSHRKSQKILIPLCTLTSSSLSIPQLVLINYRVYIFGFCFCIGELLFIIMWKGNRKMTSENGYSNL